MIRRQAVSAVLIVLLTTLAVDVAAGSGWRNHKRVRGSGDKAVKEFTLDSFKSIQLSGGIDLYVTVGESQQVTLTCDDNLIEFLEIETEHGELVIGTADRVSITPRVQCRVDISVPELEEVWISGSGDVDIRNLATERFDYRVSGSGDLTVTGEVDRFDIRISGSGDIDARDLKAKEVEVQISGSGDASVYASESIRGRVSGSGDIVYYGDPPHTSLRVSGSGTIKPRH